MKTLISVIIPVYNTKAYLKEAVDSVISQKEFLHEVILIDDGSTDGSGKLLDDLYGHLNFVKIIHKENEGQGIARNWGTDLSTGNFIYYFDSDDMLKIGLFEKFCELLFQNPELELFCFSGENFIDKNYLIDDIKNKNFISENAQKRKIEAVCNSGEEAHNLLVNNNSFFVYPFLYLFKKNILVKNDIKFKAIKNEDGEFISQLFLHSRKTLITNSVFVKYRIRQGATTQLNRSFKDIFGYIKTIETLEKLSKLHHLKHETKEILNKKILSLLKDIIAMKSSSCIKFSKEEKNVYKKSLKPLIRKNRNLFVLYFTYPLEYKLRMFKKNGLIDLLSKFFISI